MYRVLLFGAAALLGACYPGVSYESLYGDGGVVSGGNIFSGGGVTGGGGGSGGGGEAVTSGLPCDVSAVLVANCASCHGASAAVPLLTYADLASASKNNPGQTNAQVASARMKSATSPMPPSGLLPAADVAPFDQWIDAGYPHGTCGSIDAGPDPFAAAPTCTSNIWWTLGNFESRLMHPGVACIACHQTLQEVVPSSLAGTIYPSAHEPDDCDALLPAGVNVVVTGADGASFSVTPNSVGNFTSSTTPSSPWHVAVTYGGRTRSMAAAVTNGDCNLCHTQSGANGAPGRVLLP